MLDRTLTFFGLTEAPFSRPPREPYLDPARKRALDRLQRLVERRGFAVLTGASGSGKTALLHYLCDSLNENQHQIAYVPFSFLEKGQMLHYLAGQLGLEPRRGISPALCAIQKHLHGIQPVTPLIILDEVEQLETHIASLVRCLLHDPAFDRCCEQLGNIDELTGLLVLIKPVRTENGWTKLRFKPLF